MLKSDFVFSLLRHWWRLLFHLKANKTVQINSEKAIDTVNDYQGLYAANKGKRESVRNTCYLFFSYLLISTLQHVSSSQLPPEPIEYRNYFKCLYKLATVFNRLHTTLVNIKRSGKGPSGNSCFPHWRLVIFLCSNFFGFGFTTLNQKAF